MAPDVTTQLSVLVLVEKIKAHQIALDIEAHRLRGSEVVADFDKKSARSWCLSVVGDSLVRIRLLLEQNFNFVGTLGVVAVSRYLFELSIWLYLFEQDERYGLVYQGQLLETQQKYYSDNLGQIRREVEMLRLFESKEKEAQAAIMGKARPPEGHVDRLRSVARMIDAEAARKFLLYAEQAKLTGYGYQSCLVEKQAVPPVEAALKELVAEQADFDANVLPGIADLALVNGKKRHWEWKRKAESTGLLSEYDFIYTFASKLLHATPASITTNQKNLEPEEILMFLKYIDIKVVDMIDLARKYPRDAT